MHQGSTDPGGVEEDSGSPGSEIDGRLSAIMPRKLFQDDAAVKSGLLQVFVRMKPVPEGTETCMHLDHRDLLKAIWRNKEAVYKFSKVFQQEADQSTVYSGTTAALVTDFLDFKQPSAVVMAYGVTSAGKTFTMQGSPDKPGLVPLALRDIFMSLEGQLHSLRVSLAVCEIYNECIHDLLAPAAPCRTSRPAALRLKEDKGGHIVVQGMSEVCVRSAKDALELLRRAAKARQSAGTGVNERSSRSHAVITVKLQSLAATGGADAGAAGGAAADMSCVQAAGQHSFLHFVDLAGCERVKRTGNSGARLRESVAINSSLMTLARCLEVLRYNQQHPGDEKVIPYRESKITHMFKEVLHGNGRFVMLVNVSPAAQEFNETKRVLQYAALASKVTMTSEIEHVVAGEAWPCSITNLPSDATAGAAAVSAAASASAAGAAAAAASAAALAAAQTRIEELLDDKADLEYEIDVVERKVELLREELIKSEVEKEQLEADVRQEVVAEMTALMDETVAKHKAAAAKAAAEAAGLREQISQLKQQLQSQQDLLAQQEKEQEQQQLQLKEHNKRGMISRAEHKQLLAEAHQAAEHQAAAAVLQAEAAHIAQAAVLTKQHEQELSSLRSELDAAQQQAQEQAAAAAAAVQQQGEEAAQQLAALQSIATEALQLLEQAVAQQQQGALGGLELVTAAQLQLQAAQQRQQQQLQSQVEQQVEQLAGAQAVCSVDTLAGIDPAVRAVDAATSPLMARARSQQLLQASEAAALLAPTCVEEQTQEPPRGSDVPKPEQPTQRQLGSSSTSSSVRRSRRATLAAGSALPTVHGQDGAATEVDGGVTGAGLQAIISASAVQHAMERKEDKGDPDTFGLAGAAAAAAAVPVKRRRRTLAAAATLPATEASGAAGKYSSRNTSSRRRSSCSAATAAGDAGAAAAAAVGCGAGGHEGSSKRLPLQLDSITEADEDTTVDETEAAAEAVAAQAASCHFNVAAAEGQGEADGNAGAAAAAAAAPSRKRRRAQDQEPPAEQQQQALNSMEVNATRQCRSGGAADSEAHADVPNAEARTSIVRQQQQQQQRRHRQRQRQQQQQLQSAAKQEEQQTLLLSAEQPAGTLQQLQPADTAAAVETSAAAESRAAAGGLRRGGKKAGSVSEAGSDKRHRHREQAEAPLLQDETCLPVQKHKQQQQQHVVKADVGDETMQDEKHDSQQGSQLQLQEQQQTQQQGARPAPPAAAAKVGKRKATAGVSTLGNMPDDEEWQSAEHVLKDVTRQQLGLVVGRRATIATTTATAGAVSRTAGLSGQQRLGRGVGAAEGADGKGKAGSTSNSRASKLPHIAGGITPVAFRTRHARAAR